MFKGCKVNTFWIITVFSIVALFFSWLFVYKTGINTLAIQSEDTIPAMFLPVNIIKEGTFYADSYYQMIIQKYPHPDDKKYDKGLTPFYFRKIVKEDPTKSCVGEGCTLETHYISAFPVMTGLMSLPVYLIPVLAGMPVTWENLILLSHLCASLIMALSGGFFYLLLKKLVDDKKAILLTTLYLFGTVNFAMISQSLWQHGAVQLFTVLSLLFLLKSRDLRGIGLSDNIGGGDVIVKSKRSYGNLVLSGFFLGLAVLARPTAGILLPYFVILAIYLWNSETLESRLSFGMLFSIVKTKVIFLVGLIPAVVFFIWYNATYFVDLGNQGYANQVGSNWLTPFPWGFLGLWLSPSKGLLIYSPIFIFSIVGAYLALRKSAWRQNLIYLVFLSIVLTHTLILGAWKHWYGGYSFGYRMASDIIPFLILLLIPYFKSSLYNRTKRLFYGAIIASILIEFMGLAFFDGIWHGTYDKGFWHQEWLWSIQNSEVVFNIRRLLVKLGL